LGRRLPEGVRPIMFRNVKSNDRGGASLGNGLLRRCGGRWAKLSFGTLRLPEKEEEGSRACYDVRFEMGGGNSGWCSGIEFGGFELRACGLSWGQKRLLELCGAVHFCCCCCCCCWSVLLAGSSSRHPHAYRPVLAHATALRGCPSIECRAEIQLSRQIVLR
jgi:hypothetical protein